MIWWLFGHLWWGLPSILVLAAIVAFALGAWPLVLATLGRLPHRAQAMLLAVLVAAVAGSGMYAKGKADGKEGCRSAQEAAEARADAKAIKAGGRAAAKAQEASATISKETHDAADEVRVILRDRACPDGAELPPRVRELGEQAVERARRALRPAEG